MLKKYARYSIVVLIQLTGLAILTIFIATLMLNHTSSINHWHDFFTRFHVVFLIMHSLFYIALYCLWPGLIRLLAQQPNLEQINTAMRARYYLIGALLIFELLNLLR